MENILYELFNGDYNISENRNEAESKISREIIPMLNEVNEKFDEEFVDRLSDLYADRELQSNYRYYQAGFRLGVRLMLEALTSATV